MLRSQLSTELLRQRLLRRLQMIERLLPLYRRSSLRIGLLRRLKLHLLQHWLH
jgi:hypothetical protein